MAVKGLNRTETCITHHDRAAVARCATCHKPVCQECVTSTADGKFCSATCAQRAADYRTRAKQMKSGGGLKSLVKLIIWIIVIIILLGVVNRYKRLPVVGPFLDRLPVIGKKEAPATGQSNQPGTSNQSGVPEHLRAPTDQPTPTPPPSPVQQPEQLR